MGIIESASGASAWRGYSYFEAKKVQQIVKISDDEFKAKVFGTRKEPYEVKINLSYIRQSKCNCPYADGRRIICKHMVALYFTIFPKEAERFIREDEEREREEEIMQEEHIKQMKKYVYNLSKQEVREILLQYLIEKDYDDFY